MGARFQLENFSEVIDEALPLLHLHWKEISANLDIPVDVDVERYKQVSAQGKLRLFTARSEENKLIGYAVFFIDYNLHYKKSLQALQDVIFIHPKHRGIGGVFINWCDTQLMKENVQVSYHHVKAAHNFGPLLERMDYKLVDLIYMRRLDKPVDKQPDEVI